VLELVAGALLAAGVVLFVLQPIWAPRTDAAEGGPGDEGEDPDDDLSPPAVALRALKEIEFDRATGKLSDADYAALKRKYTAEALAALRADRGEGGPQPGEPAGGAAGAPLAAVVGVTPALRLTAVGSPTCPVHGPRPETDAEFCSTCGRRLAAAPGYCARCGVALEHEAKYCHACGARVAA
jgi:hypothetical protein